LYSLRRDGKEETFEQPWDQPGDGLPVTVASPRGALPTALSPDGTRLVAQDSAQPQSLSVFTLTGGAHPTATLENRFAGTLGSVSFDGRWVAYQSAVSGRNEVWVRPFPDVT